MMVMIIIIIILFVLYYHFENDFKIVLKRERQRKHHILRI